jgi:hypothetical protein
LRRAMGAPAREQALAATWSPEPDSADAPHLFGLG